MIVKLELENIGPYTDKITLDFRVNKRDKDLQDTIYTLPDGEMVSKVVGIIAEYNPFHNGHYYHLQQAKQNADADFCVAVISGNFTQKC